MQHEASFLNDTNFWYGAAVLLCVVIIFKFARKGFLAAIDGQIAKVKSELDEAKRLRTEAAATLADYRVRQEQAMQEAADIVANAKVLAAKLRKDSEVELAATLIHHEKLALDRIRLIQEEVATEVRSFMINEALVEARGKLAKEATGAESLGLIDKAIENLPKLALGKAV